MAQFYEFDGFRIDAARRTLLRDGKAVALKPKAFETLLALVQNRGRVVGKDELMQTLWPDTFVEEANLTQHISLIRKALGERAGEHRYIVTVPGRGYQFVAEVREVSGGGEAAQGLGEFELAAADTFEGAAQESINEGRKRKDRGSAGEIPQSAGESPPARTPGPRRVRRAQGWMAATAVAALIAAALTLAYVWGRRRSAGVEARHPVKSIAVLPFKSATGNGEDDYFRLGLTDALISKFNGLSQTTVRQMGEVLKFDKADRDPLEAGRKLAVDAVLDGVLQKTGDRLRVTARLLDVRTGETLWAQTFNEGWGSVFEMQDAISARVSEALALNLTAGDKQQITKRYTSNPEAYDLYLQAYYLIQRKRTAESLQKGIEYAQRAIELDPNFVSAYYILGTAYTESPPHLTPKEALEKQRELYRKTLALDDTFAGAYLGLGWVTWRQDWNWAEGERLFRRAIELQPNSSGPYSNLGILLASQGRLDEGIASMGRAQNNSPTNLNFKMLMGTLLIYARRFVEAARQNGQVLESEPNHAVALTGLGWACGHQGAYEKSFEALEKAARLEERRNSNVQALLGHFYARAGRRDDALKALERLEELQAQGRGSRGAMAVVYAGLGEKEQALAHLEKAVEGREWWASTFKVNPLFDGLRAEPKFADLIRRTGLEP